MQLEDQIIKDFAEYSTYVNEERAIPDVYDGSKPVARRILYTFQQLKLTSDKPTKKAATIVGRAMAYHPHGDSSIYGAMVRMAQPFSLRVPLVYGQGNYGSEEMPPAAARYVEAKLSKLGDAMVQKLNRGIVPMVPNYDGTEVEPKYLYAPVPILLNTGALGIGVGQMVSIPSHNLNEIIAATIAMIEKPDIETAELLRYLKGPDFPSGCEVVNQDEFVNIYSKGKGSFVLRSTFEFQGNTMKIKNLPMYSIAAKIESQIYAAKLTGAFRNVVQVVNTTAKSQELTLQLKSNYNAEELVRDLCQHTDAERTMHLDLRALENGKPRHFTIVQFFRAWLDTHYKLVRKENEIDLAELQAKLEILEGLKKALIHIDQLIATIKSSANRTAAKIAIIKIGFTENQANAILDLKLAKLTRLEAVELDKQIAEIVDASEKIKLMLSNQSIFNQSVIAQLKTYLGYDTPRQSALSSTKFAKAVKVKQDIFYLTQTQDVVRVTDEMPKIKHLICSSKSPVYLLSENYVIPVKSSKEPIFTKVLAVLNDKDVFHFSTDGYVKRTAPAELQATRKAKVTSQEQVHTILQGSGFALITTKTGKQVQFDLDEVPYSKRGARGVIAAKLGGEEIQTIELINSPKAKVPTGRNKQIK